LVPLEFDVTDKAAVENAIATAHRELGSLDVVVNNAGYGLFGMVEELSEQELRAQMETNFFGALWVTQAALPYLRAQGNGHIVQISSIAGVAAFGSLGGYNASKWALEGLSEALAQEVGGLGIRVTVVEPGAFKTDWGGSSAVHTSARLDAYDFLRAHNSGGGSTPPAPGDPDAAARALLQLVDSDNPPLRVLFGSLAVDIAKRVSSQRLDTWAEWESLSLAAQG
jgi:NAD(P)-dependent dehydrogenase (short-subunit alcohol dehydrogenase family)